MNGRTNKGADVDMQVIEEPDADTARSLTGVSENRNRSGKLHIKVSNNAGYLCHVSSEAIFPASPRLVYGILTNPDNTGVFRDIKALGYRKVLQDDPAGYKVIEVEQRGEVRILWHTHYFSTFLTVTEDGRDPKELKTSFSLIKSDVLSKFQGTWTLHPATTENGAAGATRAVLEQDVLPVGVPAFLRKMPVLGNVLRGICVRTVRRLVEDINAVITKTQQGEALQELLKPKVDSHAIDFSDDEDDEDAGRPS